MSSSGRGCTSGERPTSNRSIGPSCRRRGTGPMHPVGTRSSPIGRVCRSSRFHGWSGCCCARCGGFDCGGGALWGRLLCRSWSGCFRCRCWVGGCGFSWSWSSRRGVRWRGLSWSRVCRGRVGRLGIRRQRRLSRSSRLWRGYNRSLGICARGLLVDAHVVHDHAGSRARVGILVGDSVHVRGVAGVRG